MLEENAKLKGDLRAQAIAERVMLGQTDILEINLVGTKQREATALQALQDNKTMKGASKSGSCELSKSLRNLKKLVREKTKGFKQCLGEGKYDAEYLLRYRWHDCHFERLKKLNGVQTKELDVLLLKCRERLLSTTHTLGQDINEMLDKLLEEQEGLPDPSQTEVPKNCTVILKPPSHRQTRPAARFPVVADGESEQHPGAEKTGAQPRQTLLRLVAIGRFKEVDVSEKDSTRKEAQEERIMISEDDRSDEMRRTEKEYEYAEVTAPSSKPAMRVIKRHRDAHTISRRTWTSKAGRSKFKNP